MGVPLTWADHRIFSGPESDVVFGVEEASLFAVSAEAVDTIRRWRTTEPLLLEQVPQPDRELLQGLADARILRPGAARANGRGRLDPSAIPLSTLVLEVAQTCNLRCSYCYAEGGSYGGEPRRLDPEAARRAVGYLVERSGDRERLALILFGGEPLLNMAAVRAAADEAANLGLRTGKKIQLSLTTNGTLLDLPTIEFLHGNRVSVAVSLDGPEHVHDHNRRDVHGRGTYGEIVSRLEPLLAGTPVPVAARVTLTPDQWGQVEEVFDHLVDLGFHEVGIAPASPITSDLLPTREQEEALLVGFRRLADRFVHTAHSEGRVLPFGNVLDLLGRIHVGQTKDVACGAGCGYLAVDAQGRLFPCHRLAGEADCCVGDLAGGADPTRLQECLEWLEDGRMQDCSLCWARTLCSGGCHYENHLRERVLGLPRGSSCDFVRGWLQIGVETYAKLRAGGATEHLGPRLEQRASC